MLKVASVCLWISGLGFGLPCIYGIWHLVREKSIAIFMGFPTYGNGPFERIGIQTTVPLMTAFLFACTLECICGWGVWRGDKGAAMLSFLMIPIEAFFYFGFALPFGPPVVVIRIILLVLAWSALH